MRRPGQRALTTADDATVIEGSWHDPDLFEALVDRHASHIHRYFVRRVGRELADDLAAETFLAAFGKRRTYDLSYRDCRPWLYGIAANLVGQHRREEARQYRIMQAALPDAGIPGHAERVAADVTAQAIRKVLAEALGALSPGDRDVLTLIAWEDLSYSEVARVLAIPIGTVRSRLHRARRQVREALSNTGAAAAYEEIMANE